MQYSLYTLNQCSKLNNLTLTNLINKLNLIGFEVDEIFSEPLQTNSNIENIRLLIKIPSNREDLLNENFLKKELSTIFFLELDESWKKLQNNYLFLLKQKYNQFYNYQTFTIKSPSSNILMYNIHVNQCNYKKTPQWIKNKLSNAGLGTSSTFNDLLSLITFEWGQTIKVLMEKEVENTLNQNDFFIEQLQESTPYNNIILEKGTVVFKNTKNEILSILGIINNLTEVSQNSNAISLQVYFYDIHENLLNLNTINTKLSFRFLRKSYLQTLRFAFQRLLTLIELITEGNILLKKYSTNNILELKNKKIIIVKIETLKKLLKIQTIDLEIFQKANLKLLCKTPEELYFEIPSWRKDLNREIDLIEEYCRFIGYKNFLEISPKKEIKFYSKPQLANEFIKQFFLNYGFTEIITTSLEDINKQKSASISLNNPLNTDLISLRTSLLPKLIDIYSMNLKTGNIQTNLFEIGRVFKNSNQKIIEQDKLAGIFQFNNIEKGNNSSFEWFRAKGFVEAFLENFDLQQLEFEKIQTIDSIYHPTRSSYIKYKDKIIGLFGELNPLKMTVISKTPIYIFEFNCHYLKYWKMKSKISMYQETSKYPSVVKDLSFQVSIKNSFTKIKQSIIKNCENLRNVEFFDIYFDEKIKDYVNLGIRLEFQSKTQTLLTEVIEKEILNLQKLLIEEFGVTFRT